MDNKVERDLNHDLHNALFKGVQKNTKHNFELVLEKGGVAYDVRFFSKFPIDVSVSKRT